MKTSDFDYPLPSELIAQVPLDNRQCSRLMQVSRVHNKIEHLQFYDIGKVLRTGDVLVLNDSRVIPARLMGRRASGGTIEILLLHRSAGDAWETLVKPARKAREGDLLEIATTNGRPLKGEVVGMGEGGIRFIRFCDEASLETAGQVPLPPYIHTPLINPERYQTVYAREKGSVAAPTAGLHFTPQLLQSLQENGVEIVFVTLHIGLDTFRPVRVEDPHEHDLHKEYGEVCQQTAYRINQAKADGRRIVCVGTTTVRLLEQSALYGNESEVVKPFKDWASLFILPGFQFRVTDAMVTNFHLPRSTLLMLVSTFAGKQLISEAYRSAMDNGYRFYSFGDAMLIT